MRISNYMNPTFIAKPTFGGPRNYSSDEPHAAFRELVSSMLDKQMGKGKAQSVETETLKTPAGLVMSPPENVRHQIGVTTVSDGLEHTAYLAWNDEDRKIERLLVSCDDDPEQPARAITRSSLKDGLPIDGVVVDQTKGRLLYTNAPLVMAAKTGNLYKLDNQGNPFLFKQVQKPSQ